MYKNGDKLCYKKLKCTNYKNGISSEYNNAKWQFCYCTQIKKNKQTKKNDVQKYKLVILNEQFITPKDPNDFLLMIVYLNNVSYEKTYYKDRNGNMQVSLVIVLYVYVATRDNDLTEVDKANIRHYTDKAFTETIGLMRNADVEPDSDDFFSNNDMNDDIFEDNQDLPF